MALFNYNYIEVFYNQQRRPTDAYTPCSAPMKIVRAILPMA